MMKQYGIKSIFASTLMFLLGFNSVEAGEYSIGGQIGSQGVGVSLSGKTPWSINNEDQIQWRVSANGIAINDIGDNDLNSRDYDADLSKLAVQAGFDWYPFAGGFPRQIFFSGGISHIDQEFDGVTEPNQTFTIDGTTITTSTDNGFITQVEHSSVAPYLSFGWGDRLQSNRLLSFRFELGVLAALSDAEVSVNRLGNSDMITDAILEQENREVDDDIDTIMGFVNFGLTFQF